MDLERLKERYKIWEQVGGEGMLECFVGDLITEVERLKAKNELLCKALEDSKRIRRAREMRRLLNIPVYPHNK